jgi:uncharacterized protein
MFYSLYLNIKEGHMKLHFLYIILILSGLLSCNTLQTGYVATENNLEIHMVESDDELLETAVELPLEGIEQTGFVVFIRGSGSGDMKEYFPGFMDKYLRDVFLHQGYGLVYQNKRGIGNSTGNWKKDSSFDSMSDDVLAVIEYYKNLDSISSDSIGIIGHSQGGWVVQRIAGKEHSGDHMTSRIFI